ncbi:MAG: HesA/MoeB/ThiF family protein [Pseudomonadota bacterium]
MGLSDEDLERYARHIVLREIGGPGQGRLRRARVAVVGAGGLGSPALLYLAAAGVGRIRVIDDDAVSLSNLQRQVLHRTGDIGRPKVESAAEALGALNPGVAVEGEAVRLSEENAAALLDGVDLILDGSDSFKTRRLVNRTATKLGVPLLSGAIGAWEGQIALFDPARGGPCYHCLFPEDPPEGASPACSEAGVLGALAGVVGCIMAVEAVKHLAKAGETLSGRLMLYDALHAESRVIRISRRCDCEVCGDRAPG